MLNEIYCDKFKKNKIEFKDGLNVILGTNNGDNSIGKSTFLLIVDYVFGGSSYCKNKDIEKNIGDHNIGFSYSFSGKKYYFLRKYSDKTHVYKCDDKYLIKEEMKLNEFNEWLQENYKLDFMCKTFRENINSYIRISSKGNIKHDYPLHSFDKDKSLNGIDRLFDIFNEYKKINDLNEDIKDDRNKLEAYKKAIKNEVIKSISKKEYENNINELKRINNKIDEINRQFKLGTINNEVSKYEEINYYINDLKRAQRIKAKLENRLFEITNSKKCDFSLSSKDIEKLKVYFPDTNIKKLKEIDNFHTEISRIFKKEIMEEKNEIIKKISENDEIIDFLEKKIEEKNAQSDIDNETIITYEKNLKKKIAIEEENNTYINFDKLQREKKDLDKKLDEERNEVTDKVEKKVNDRIAKINNEVFKDGSICAKLKINKNNYSYTIENNIGTGDGYKNLIIYDFSILELTKLPILVHDNEIFKNISDINIEKIIKKYNSYNKQIIISFDKQSNLDKDTKKLLQTNCVLELGINGKELFGKSWKYNK